ncbi:MAG TPA: hypothetical protein VGL86_05845 [Polyangia bacterium]|jgi:hypothetical protein
MVTPKRTAALPPLVYVLATFGVISGSYGALRAISSATMFAKPREVYLAMVTAQNEALKPLVDAPTLEKYDAHEADARYGRRNAALPLAGVGLVLSCLMFAGAMRAMRGDGWGLSAWSFSAAACIPYQLLNLALTFVTARDLGKAVAELPPMAQLIVGNAQLLASIFFCAVAILYYGVCVIYLRTAGVKSAFSDAAARTPPSA